MKWMSASIGISVLACVAILATCGCRRAPAVPASDSPESERSLDDSGVSSIGGSVRDEHGPMTDSRVRWKGHVESVITDADGRFRLPALDGGPAQVTAWKEGYFIAGSPADASPLLLRLRQLPREDNEHYKWIDPQPNPIQKQNCGNCHGDIYREWAQSGHARSAGNRRFLNLYDGTDWSGNKNIGWSLLRDRPDGSGVCTACHAPTLPLENSAYLDIRKAAGVAGQGVHCDYCHKIADIGNGAIGLTHGRFNLQLLRPHEGQLFFGPLDDVDRGEDAYSPLYRMSRYCASCHEGTVFGVHVYSTYSEWLESPARKEGKQCQTCHMTPTGKLTNVAPGNGGVERDPKTLGNHLFFAGSQAEMLRRCLKVSMTAEHKDGAVRVQVEMSVDDVGHRVPTGFIDRNLVLLVDGIDAHGNPVGLTEGPTLSDVAGRMVAGRPGRLYAKLLADPNGREPMSFWQAESDPVDNRLTPGRPDRSRYLFPANLQEVRVRVLYRRFWPQVAEVKRWPDSDLTVFDQRIRPKNSHSSHP